MAVTVTAIPKVEGKNPTGYKRVWAAPEQNVAAIPAAAAGDVATPITMNDLEVFSELPIDSEAGAFCNSEGVEGEGTTGDNHTFTAFLAGKSAAQRAAADTYDGVYCILICERMDGVHEILGEKGRGIRLRRNLENETRSGILLQGSATYNHLPYEYSDGTIPT